MIEMIFLIKTVCPSLLSLDACLGIRERVLVFKFSLEHPCVHIVAVLFMIVAIQPK